MLYLYTSELQHLACTCIVHQPFQHYYIQLDFFSNIEYDVDVCVAEWKMLCCDLRSPVLA